MQQRLERPIAERALDMMSVFEVQPAWTFVRDRRYLALRTGVAAACASVAPSFARGLLPRSAADQAMVTGASAAYWLGFSALGLSTVEAVAELYVKAKQSGDPENLTLAASAVVGAVAGGVIAAVPDTSDVPMSLAVAQSVAWIMTGGALASGLVVGADKLMDRYVGPRPLPVDLGVAAAIGGVAAGIRVELRNRRARRYGEGEISKRRPVRAERRPVKLAKAVGYGAATAAGLVAIAGTQFGIAEGTTKLVSTARGRKTDPVTPLVGHAAAATILAGVGVVVLDRTRRRIMATGDIVEPAYPDPPTSPHVSAGPRSEVDFADIGKEGRRFVLMALSPQEITAVMGEPAISPIRVVAGFGSAKTPQDRAAVALAEMERLGAFERSLIVVAAPTGVGYVNYSFAEAVEYLTRGDCAIVVPQYALVPSALALSQTDEGIELQRAVLAGIRDRVADRPEQDRPRVVQFGESLGAQVALDVARDTTAEFDELGVTDGLYLGTPFRTKLWERWFANPSSVDPAGILGQVAAAPEIAELGPSVRHVQVIHHDDPINKFGYATIFRAPWWMGPPLTRPPGVPRETVFRPVITFIINLVDLKNGMNSKPGKFLRVGHDYRIELAEAVRLTYDLPAQPQQLQTIEIALRAREQEWATRRMVASRFARARDSVRSQLSKWGVDSDTLDIDELTASALARGHVSAPGADQSTERGGQHGG